jgi:hypothetical protein
MKKSNQKIKIIAVVALFLAFVNTSKGQYDAMFTQYMFNEMFINPAYAGSKEAMSATLLHRQQWVNFPGRPVTTTFSLHGPLMQNKMGLGVSVLNEKIGINKGFMTTIHSYTGDQNVVDGSHKSDMRRARACGVSMVPTSTGAAKAIGLVLPELKGKLDGSAIRVPTPNVSVVDLTFEASRKTSVAEVNELLKNASEGELSGILGFQTKPLVSIDFNHTSYSSIVDSLETKVIGENMVRVLSWYDNEWGFSIRMLDVAKFWNKL